MPPGPEERLLAVLAVVAPGQPLVDLHQLHPHRLKAATLEAADHLADQPTLHPVGLDQHQGASDSRRS